MVFFGSCGGRIVALMLNVGGLAEGGVVVTLFVIMAVVNFCTLFAIILFRPSRSFPRPRNTVCNGPLFLDPNPYMASLRGPNLRKLFIFWSVFLWLSGISSNAKCRSCTRVSIGGSSAREQQQVFCESASRRQDSVKMHDSWCQISNTSILRSQNWIVF